MTGDDEARVREAWLTQRTAEFAGWTANNSGLADKISALTQATKALAAERQRARGDLSQEVLSGLAARSAALGAQRRAPHRGQQDEASRLFADGDAKGAEALYRTILADDPANSDINFALGTCLRGQGDLAGAAWYLSIAASFPEIGSDNGYFKSMVALQALPSPSDPALDQPCVVFRVDGAPQHVWDAPFAPRMTIIPGGEFTMGSLDSEAHHTPAETPHRVTLAYPLAVSTTDITRGEFAAFVGETGYEGDDAAGCQVFKDGTFVVDPEGSWRNPGFAQGDDEPVVCVSYYDGLAYAEWLSRKTGQSYRLPSEAEWEYAVRGGTSTSYYWGEELGLGNAHCDGCNPGAAILQTVRCGSFPPNPFGLYDVCGNVWKWLADAWNPNYLGAPSDGSAWMEGTTVLRGRRGGSWFNISEPRAGEFRAPYRLRSAARFGSLPHLRFASFGLRLVRDL